MSTNFTEKFAAAILSVLDCHDRVIFKGYFPFHADQHPHGWGRRSLNCMKDRAGRSRCIGIGIQEPSAAWHSPIENEKP